MKRAIISALFAAGVVGVASADIQAPPASEYTPTRKLGRAKRMKQTSRMVMRQSR